MISLGLTVQSPSEERIHLVYENGFDWKGVFDAGFRPKHVRGIESSKAEQDGVTFDLRFSEDSPAFRLRDGRVTFDVLKGGEVSLMEHREHVPITSEEVETRVAEFEALLDGVKIQEFSSPTRFDVSAENDLVVRMGKHTVSFGFSRSGDAAKPFQVVLSVGLSNNRGLVRRRLDRPIEPPVGYEWWDMTPLDPRESAGCRVEGARRS